MAVVHGVIFNDKHLAAILLKLRKFVKGVFSTFRISCGLGRGYLLEISIYDWEGKIIAIHVGLGCKLFCIAQCLLTFLQSMPNRVHATLRA